MMDDPKQSFAGQVKWEIAYGEREECCEKAQLAAMLQLMGTLSISSGGLALVVTTTNPNTARKIWKLVKKIYDVDIRISVMSRKKLKKVTVHSLRILNKTREILEDVGLWTDQGLQRIPTDTITKKECCKKSYLSGCFLASGSVNSPNTSNYHLEMVTVHEAHAKYILKMMNRIHVPAKMTERRGQYVVYLKSSEKISDFLNAIGATDAAYHYADIIIQRDYVNNINRMDNCMVANDMKSVAAGLKQIEAIEFLKEHGGIDTLDAKLKDVALIRLEYPDTALSELAIVYEERTGVSISKSGLKHRLDKIMALAEKRKTLEQ